LSDLRIIFVKARLRILHSDTAYGALTAPASNRCKGVTKMAFFRIEIKNHGRGMASKQAYRFGSKTFDQHHQRHFDYRSKGDVLHKEVIMPKEVPEWARSETEFWGHAEKVSNRQDARIAKEFVLSFPREIELKDSKRLAQEFIHQEFTRNGLGATLAIHNPRSADGSQNPHAHILVSMRPIDKNGFAKRKLRGLDRANGIRDIREQWANTLNKEFERQKLPERVSPHKTRRHPRAGKLLERAQQIGRKRNTPSKGIGLQWAGRTPALRSVSRQLAFYNRQLSQGQIPNPITNKRGAISLARKIGRESFKDNSKEQDQERHQHGHVLELTR